MIVYDPVYGCELAQGRPDGHGYVFHGRTRAHIAAWVAAMGPVQDGYEVDHLCRRRSCCALHHLEAVSKSENLKRRSFAYRLKRTHCRFGHPLDEHRVVTPEGGIVCRACARAAAEGAKA